jgi:hypothetical protein
MKGRSLLDVEIYVIGVMGGEGDHCLMWEIGDR